MTLRFTDDEYNELMRNRPGRIVAELVKMAKKPRARSRELEHQEAVAFIKWRDLNLRSFPELEELYAIPNAGKRSEYERGYLLDEGLKSGVSDYHLPVARGGFIGLYAELKAEGGEASDKQLEWIRKMRHRGHRAEVVVGWEALRDLCIDYLKSGVTTVAATSHARCVTRRLP